MYCLYIKCVYLCTLSEKQNICKDGLFWVNNTAVFKLDNIAFLLLYHIADGIIYDFCICDPCPWCDCM